MTSKAEAYRYSTSGELPTRQVRPITEWKKRKGEWVIVRIARNIYGTVIFSTISVGPIVCILFLTGVISLNF